MSEKKGPHKCQEIRDYMSGNKGKHKCQEIRDWI